MTPPGGARFLVVAPQTAGNSLGRALGVADMLGLLGEVRLAAEVSARRILGAIEPLLGTAP